MTRIRDLKGSKAVPQSTSLGAQVPLVPSDDATMRWIDAVNLDWGKNIWPRLDEDERLWTGEPYILTGAKGETLDDVISVTMNDARVFGERVSAVENEAEELIEINGQRDGKALDGHQTAVIEDWWRDLMYLANENLSRMLMPDFDAYEWEQVNIRGGMIARILLSEDHHGFDIDLLPVDRRKCVYAIGYRGISRVAFWDILDIETVREQYPDFRPTGGTLDVAAGVSPSGLTGVVRWDYWDANEEVIFLDGKFYEAIPNRIGHPPFAIALCQQGTFLDTTHRAMRMRGDSIYSANRDLYPELNRIASILQTMNVLSLAPPQTLKSKSGKKLPSEPIYRAGRILALETEDELRKIDAPDIKGAARFFMATLGGNLQRGSISHVEWGNLQFQLSQVAIATLAGASKQVFSPRLKTMERFKKLLFKEARFQFELFNLTADIGRHGSKRTYRPEDISGNYTLDFEYLPNLPEETAASYGLANMAERWMDDKSIRKTILKYRDYDDIDEKYLIQQARRVSRALSLFQQAQAFDKQADLIQDKAESSSLKDQARILLIEVGATLSGEVKEQIATLTGTEIPEAPPEQPLAAGEQVAAPPTGVTRTTRKAEPVGAGEIEEETGG